MTQKKVCKMFRMNKKGAEMTIGTIVMIILALVVGWLFAKVYNAMAK